MIFIHSFNTRYKINQRDLKRDTARLSQYLQECRAFASLRVCLRTKRKRSIVNDRLRVAISLTGLQAL